MEKKLDKSVQVPTYEMILLAEKKEGLNHNSCVLWEWVNMKVWNQKLNKMCYAFLPDEVREWCGFWLKSVSLNKEKLVIKCLGRCLGVVFWFK